MDLAVISQKVDDKLYQNFHQLECDLRLIVNNSEQYNGEFNGFTTNSKAVWRLFRRLTKKYLNHDLSVEDQEAFIFPPRINYAKKRDSSSVDPKKRKKQKKSSKFQALELLYNATQDSIESTFQRFAFSPASDSENKQLNENLPKKYQFAADKPAGFYNEAFANLNNYSYQDGFYTEENRNENLVFKSLNEWNKQLDEDGLSIVLPDKTIFVNYSPVDVNWLTNFPNDQPPYKTVFNETLFQKPIDGQLYNGQLIINRHSTHCRKEKSLRGRKAKASTRSRAKESKTSEKCSEKSSEKSEKNGKDSRATPEDCKMLVDKERKEDLSEKNSSDKDDSKSLFEDNSLASAGQIDQNDLPQVKVEPQDEDLEAKEEHLVNETKQIDLNEKNSRRNGEGSSRDSQTNNQANGQANSQASSQTNGHENVQGELKQKKRLVIKLSKLNNDWKPINLNGSHDSNQSGSSSDSSSDSSCSSSCSCDSDSNWKLESNLNRKNSRTKASVDSSAIKWVKKSLRNTSSSFKQKSSLH